ncbi:hypothetical protein [Scytonema sp. NUACC26]|uniref:hypothetical protein n=1 Tax=Scytonema sp. NUACC26 TaxID=3140176 RepID=UPI0034DBDEBC
MKKIEHSFVGTISHRLDSTSNPGVITVFQANNNLPTVPGSTKLNLNVFIKNFRAFAIIQSLAPVRLPNYTLEDSESDKTYKMLDIEWGSARKQLDLFIGVTGQPWQKVGAISLLNPSGYPYRIYNLQDLYTPNLAIELGENGKLGVQVVDVGHGVLQGNDFITIHGSYTQEWVGYEGSELTLCTDESWNISSTSQVILPANSTRGRIALVNSGSKPIYLSLGNTAQLGKGILLSTFGSSFEMDISSGVWKGAISAISEEPATLTGMECTY